MNDYTIPESSQYMYLVNKYASESPSPPQPHVSEGLYKSEDRFFSVLKKKNDYGLPKSNQYVRLLNKYASGNPAPAQACSEGSVEERGAVFPSVDGDGIEKVFFQKIDRTKGRIETLIEAIDKRRDIKELNLYGIEKNLADCDNIIFDMGYKVYRRDREWAAIETKKIDLDRDRRMEESAYFRDIMLLGKELRDTMMYYKSLVDKFQMFGGNQNNEIQL